MKPDELRALVEAILFTARGPVTVDAVVESLADKEITAELVSHAVIGFVVISLEFHRPGCRANPAQESQDRECP